MGRVSNHVPVTPLGNGRYLIQQGTSSQLAFAVTAGRETWVFLDGRAYVVAASGRTST